MYHSCLITTGKMTCIPLTALYQNPTMMDWMSLALAWWWINSAVCARKVKSAPKLTSRLKDAVLNCDSWQIWTASKTFQRSFQSLSDKIMIWEFSIKIQILITSTWKTWVFNEFVHKVCTQTYSTVQKYYFKHFI